MASMMFRKVPTEMLDYLSRISEENRCRVKSRQWQHRHNTYMIYDFEPLCATGFDMNVRISGDKFHLDFVKYLYNKHSRAIAKLAAIYNFESSEEISIC